MRVAVLFLTLLWSSLAWAGGNQTITVPPGLIELKVGGQSGEVFTDIAWEARQPIDLDYRVYHGGYIFVTYGAPGSRFIVTSESIKIDWDKKTFDRDRTNWIVTVQGEPQPPGPTPPTPDPTPPTPDPDEDAPFPSNGLAVMIIREASEISSLPISQRSIFTSAKVINYLQQKCIKLEDGHAAARIWDDDYQDDQIASAPQTIRDAYKAAKRTSSGKLPWIVISTGRRGYAGPLPATIDDTIALLQKYGG